MGKPINENPNPAPRMNAPVVQLNPSSEVAALRERCEKAEARAERLADYVVADLALTAATLGDGSNREVAEKNQLRIEALAAIRVHRDLEGGAA